MLLPKQVSNITPTTIIKKLGYCKITKDSFSENTPETIAKIMRIEVKRRTTGLVLAFEKVICVNTSVRTLIRIVIKVKIITSVESGIFLI